MDTPNSFTKMLDAHMQRNDVLFTYVTDNKIKLKIEWLIFHSVSSSKYIVFPEINTTLSPY